MPNNHGQWVITIDGSAASGKSTLAKNLAKTYNAVLIPYNMLFRLIAQHMLEQGFQTQQGEPSNAQIEEAIACAQRIVQSMEPLKLLSQAAQDPYISGEDVSQAAPYFSGIPALLGVTDPLVQKLIHASRCQPVVVEGRTLGKYVYPQADMRFYVDADLSLRADRRARGLGTVNKDAF